MLLQKLTVAATAFVLLAGCSPSSGTQTATGAPTEADVKAHVTKAENSLIGTGTSHTKVELTFQEITYGTSRATNAQDRIDGVRAETIYPVQVKYQSLRSWPDGTTRTIDTNYRYSFFVDNFGKWDAIGVGPAN